MRVIRTICVLAGIFCSVQLFAQTPAIPGTWQGSLNAGGTNLRIVLHIAETNGSLSATMDSPDQGAKGIPVSSIAVRNDSLVFSISQVNGSYAGRILPDAVITGEWKQGSLGMPLEFRRTADGGIKGRPQDPVKPYPYIEQEVAFSNPAAGVNLSGTLTLPDSKGPFPVVVLISGSGPQNRNSTIMGHSPFLVIADYLTRRGIAVLRYDERGIGKSTGKFAQATSQDFAADVQAAVAYLATRSDIDAKHIGLIGHSEGGMIAPMVATNSRDVSFLVLLAGPGLPGQEVLCKQGEMINRTAGMSSDLVAASSALQKQMFDAVAQAKDSADAYSKLSALISGATGREKELIEAQELKVDEQMPVLWSPWFRYFLTYDPRPTLKKVAVPVLALNGEKDVQVEAASNLKSIEQTLKAGGNKAVTVKALPGLNHLFQTSQTGLPAEYGTNQETFSPKALEIIGDWIVAHTK